MTRAAESMVRHLASACTALLLAATHGCEAAPVSPYLGPLTLEIVAGGELQEVEVNTAVPIRPTVRVTDERGRGVAGLTIRFALTRGGGGAVNVTNPVSDKDGLVVADWQASTLAGAQVVTATIEHSSPTTPSASRSALNRESSRSQISTSLGT
jgi:hypothetical protein